jgi:hypothetical protein
VYLNYCIYTKNYYLLIHFLVKSPCALTTDSWTSFQDISYAGFTCHYISDDWKLKAISLGIEQHEGTALATDHLRELKQVLEKWALQYENIVAVTTDTEPTMNSFGRLIVDDSEKRIEHVGCIDHILNIITKKVAIDPTNVPQPTSPTFEAEKRTLKAARELVSAFSHSTQLMDVLITQQKEHNEAGVRAVKVIQDVPTRWWSTFAMIDRLLRLKKNITAIAQYHPSVTDLTAQQWELLAAIKV